MPASSRPPADTTISYTFDAESQIKTAAGVTYLYDGSGRRVSKSSGKLYWYGSGGEILAETTATGATLNEYIFFAGKRVAMLPAGGNPEYYAEDLLGSSRVTTTNNGTVCYDADFYPYGGERAYTNSCPSANVYKFEGKERDAETGNDDFGARYYSNRFGRWLSADWSAVPAPVPYANLTNPQTLNLYSMVSDDPESFADLDGHVENASQGGAKESGGNPSCAANGQGGNGSANSGKCGANQTAQQTQDQQQAEAARQQAQNQNQDQNQKNKSQDAGVKAPPTDKPPLPPPPGKGPNGEPNEWVKKPGTDGKPYGPVYEPKYPVPDTPNGSQPRVHWDSPDGKWSRDNGNRSPREHFDRWGNKINQQALAQAATKTAVVVVIIRVLIYAAEAALAF
jgi:RHS repeat-associated protein